MSLLGIPTIKIDALIRALRAMNINNPSCPFPSLKIYDQQLVVWRRLWRRVLLLFTVLPNEANEPDLICIKPK